LAEISQSLEGRQLLDELATQVVAACDAVIARVWVIGPGDECETCPMLPECPSQIRCLHLVASAGLSNRLDGAFHRFPLGAREVGQTAVSGTPLVAGSGLAAAGLADEAWLARHAVRSFAAVPLKTGARILGVVAAFSRRSLSDDEVRLLGLAASLAARALEAIGERRVPAKSPPPDAAPKPAPARGKSSNAAPHEPAERLTLAEAQRRAIARALEECAGRISGPGGAAELLGLHPNTLASRMIRLGMRRRAPRGSRS